MLPYYLALRALTVLGAPNVLVVGKSVASSFFANAAIRLHPEEWSIGVGAGVAAAMMADAGWTSEDAVSNVNAIQARLRAIGQPLNWTLPATQA